MKFVLSTIALSLFCVSCANNAHINKNIETQSTVTPKSSSALASSNLPKNIIMIVGDGMGPAYTSAYRYFSDNPSTPEVEETVFDRNLKGMASTYPAPVSGAITDSAAAATALATGVKSYNDAIGVDVNKQAVQTVLEWAKLQGKKTGVVVTSQINHATPASYLAHNEHRRNYNQIADSYIDNGIKADLYLGGGWKYFIRKDRNLVNEFKQAGFHYIDNYHNLSTIPNNQAVLGLFDDKGLPWALDDTNKYRLTTMTKSAVNHLDTIQKHDDSPDNGFFLLVEGSQIDWAGHSNDIASAMAEMDDLAKTIEYLETYVAKHPDTLVIVTADHSTGGLATGKITGYTNDKIKSKYIWNPQFIKKMKMSPETMSKKIVRNELSLLDISEMLTFKITPEEYALLSRAKIDGKLIASNYKKHSSNVAKLDYPPKDYSQVMITIKKIIDNRTNTGWGSISASASHNSIDVQVFSFGARSEVFQGFQDNTDIAKKIFKLLGK